MKPTLGFLAAHTKRARLMTFVTGVHYRYPAILALEIIGERIIPAIGKLEAQASPAR